jgi:hypothetical protein
MRWMGGLHLTKVAVGCATVDELRERIGNRTDDRIVAVETRYRPTRAEALVGGSLFWIVRHRLVGRQTILGFAEAEGGRCAIRLDARFVPVLALPRRAHQGWRYLDAKDAPADLVAGTDVSALPPRLVEELAALALL